MMLGFNATRSRGHFTSGGTVANFEALWRARYRMDHWLSMAAYLLEKGLSSEDLFQLAHHGWVDFYASAADQNVDMHDLRQRSYVLRGPWDIASYYRDTLKINFPQPVILVPGNKHYCWPKSANIFGISENAIWTTQLDRHGRVSVESLAEKIERAKKEQRPIMMNVSVAGTTELGTVDPLDDINDLLRKYREDEGIHIWHHVDAAFGGYFCSTYRDGPSELEHSTASALASINRADSITLDPHKLGFVPYACGAFLVRDAHGYSVSHMSAPYLDEEKDLDYPTWSTTLEGSRSATGAGAVWSSLREANQLTEKLIGQVDASPSFTVTRTVLSLANYHRLIDAVVNRWDGLADDDHLLVVRMVVMSPYLSDTQASDRFIIRFISEIKQFVEAQGAQIE